MSPGGGADSAGSGLAAGSNSLGAGESGRAGESVGVGLAAGSHSLGTGEAVGVRESVGAGESARAGESLGVGLAAGAHLSGAGESVGAGDRSRSYRPRCSHLQCRRLQASWHFEGQCYHVDMQAVQTLNDCGTVSSRAPPSQSKAHHRCPCPCWCKSCRPDRPWGPRCQLICLQIGSMKLSCRACCASV